MEPRIIATIVALALAGCVSPTGRPGRDADGAGAGKGDEADPAGIRRLETDWVSKVDVEEVFDLPLDRVQIEYVDLRYAAVAAEADGDSSRYGRGVRAFFDDVVRPHFVPSVREMGARFGAFARGRAATDLDARAGGVRTEEATEAVVEATTRFCDGVLAGSGLDAGETCELAAWAFVARTFVTVGHRAHPAEGTGVLVTGEPRFTRRAAEPLDRANADGGSPDRASVDDRSFDELTRGRAAATELCASASLYAGRVDVEGEITRCLVEYEALVWRAWLEPESFVPESFVPESFAR